MPTRECLCPWKKHISYINHPRKQITYVNWFRVYTTPACPEHGHEVEDKKIVREW